MKAIKTWVMSIIIRADCPVGSVEQLYSLVVRAQNHLAARRAALEFCWRQGWLVTGFEHEEVQV